MPTSDGRTIVLTPYTKPEKEHEPLLAMLGMKLPDQPNPRLLDQVEEAREPRQEPEPSPIWQRFEFGTRKPPEKKAKYGRRRILQCRGDLYPRNRGFSRP